MRWSFTVLSSYFFFFIILRPPRSTPFPTRRSSDLSVRRRRWLDLCFGPAVAPARSRTTVATDDEQHLAQIGRASCRGKSVDLGGRRIIKKKKIKKRKER